QGTTNSAHLFLFIRARDRTAAWGQNLAANLALRDLSGGIACSFSPDETRSDLDTGWLAFSAEAASGTYVLSYVGEIPREVPVHLYPHWSTQLFLLYDRQLSFEDLKVFLAPVGAGFTPDDPTVRAVDLALDWLRYQEDPPAPSTLARAEFTNPMFGLVGTH